MAVCIFFLLNKAVSDQLSSDHFGEYFYWDLMRRNSTWLLSFTLRMPLWNALDVLIESYGSNLQYILIVNKDLLVHYSSFSDVSILLNIAFIMKVLLHFY